MRVPLIAMLNDAQILIMGLDLQIVQTLNFKKIHSFCMNMAVYRGSHAGNIVSQTDQVCVATQDKNLHYFEVKLSQTDGRLKLKEDERYERG